MWRAVRRRDGLLATVVAVPLLGFASQPYQWWARFSIALVGPGAVLVVLALTARRRGLGRTAVRAVAVTLVVVAALAASHRLYTVSGSPLSVGRLLHLATEPRGDATPGNTYLAQVGWVDSLPAGTRIAVEHKDRYYDGFSSHSRPHLQLTGSGSRPALGRKLLAELGKLRTPVSRHPDEQRNRPGRPPGQPPSHFAPLGTADTENDETALWQRLPRNPLSRPSHRRPAFRRTAPTRGHTHLQPASGLRFVGLASAGDCAERRVPSQPCRPVPSYRSPRS